MSIKIKIEEYSKSSRNNGLSMSRNKFSFAQQTCIKKAGLALQRSGALWPGCRVGLALSGGVDSFTLLKVMRIRQRVTPFNFEIMALHINAGFDRNDHARLLDWLGKEGIAGHIEVADFGPKAHSEDNGTGSACFYCARQRRRRLFELCRQYNLSHLAFGHNAEDLLSSFIMNFCRNGRVQGMKMNEAFFGGKLHVIRPLLFVEKKYLQQAARQWQLPVWPNGCPSSGKTGRDQATELTFALEEKLRGARKSMINALIRQQLDWGVGD